MKLNALSLALLALPITSFAAEPVPHQQMCIRDSLMHTRTEFDDLSSNAITLLNIRSYYA